MALIVRFAPFSELVEWESNLSPESLEVKNFDKEEYFKEREEKEMSLSFLEEQYSRKTTSQPRTESNVLKISDYHQKTDEKQSTQELMGRGLA